MSVSAGESQLRIVTRGPEPRNRRVEVRFDPQPRGRFLPEPELTPPSRDEGEGQPTPPVCIAHPEQCLPEPPDPGVAPCGPSTDCAAASVDRFDKQPAVLRRLITRSFEDPAGWFEGLDAQRRFALTAIFNRLCHYGLLCHVRTIASIRPGEPLVGDLFRAPGSTPSVFFTSPALGALPGALLDTGRFCMAHGIGASQHPGPSFREISGSDSLHVSIEKGEIEVHIDVYSPVPEPPGSSFCSNAPTPAAVAHIGGEVVPGKVREATGIPGVQVPPEPAPPAPVPPGAVGPEPYRSSPGFSVPGVVGLLLGALLEMTRLTLRGPVRPPPRAPDVPPLPGDLERRLAQEIAARVRSNALVPPQAERELAAASRARELAGPDEEERLIAVQEAARERVESFAEAHEVARDMARRMDQARSGGRPAFVVPLGPAYARLSPPAQKAILGEIRDIARIVRALLGERAASVYKVWVLFGEDVMWDITF
jgi:hypothetical protein